MRFQVYEEAAGGTYNCLMTNSWQTALSHAEKIDLKRTPYIRDNKFNLIYKIVEQSWYQTKIVKTRTSITMGQYPYEA